MKNSTTLHHSIHTDTMIPVRMDGWLQCRSYRVADEFCFIQCSCPSLSQVNFWLSSYFSGLENMEITWGDIGAVRRMLQDPSSKYFEELQEFCGQVLSLVSTIPFKIFLLRLFLMLCLSLNNALHYISALIVALHYIHVINSDPSLQKRNLNITFLSFCAEQGIFGRVEREYRFSIFIHLEGGRKWLHKFSSYTRVLEAKYIPCSIYLNRWIRPILAAS